jgi:hypothetical protein
MKTVWLLVLLVPLALLLSGCHWHHYQRDYYYSERPSGFYRSYHYRDYRRYPYGYHRYRDRYND